MKQKKPKKPRNSWTIKPVQKPHSSVGYNRSSVKKNIIKYED